MSVARLLMVSVLTAASFTGRSWSEPLDLSKIPLDLTVPPVVAGEPTAGKRVKCVHPGDEKTDLFHALYLPPEWKPGGKSPVVFEYPGNGPYRDARGDTSSGRLEDCVLGYGMTGGTGAIWVCLPFVNSTAGAQQLQWWGDADATVAYCKRTVERVCREFGGDRERLVLAGFSRGAIAVNYIGLRDDAIAGLWRATVAHSHYDGVIRWPYADSDPKSATARLKRLSGRSQWISHETDVGPIRRFVEASEVPIRGTFVSLPFPNHTATWVLRDIPERRQLRAWWADVLRPADK